MFKLNFMTWWQFRTLDDVLILTQKPNFYIAKIQEKIRETLFTFKLYSFWRDFTNSNFGFCDRRYLAAILGSIETKVDLPL